MEEPLPAGGSCLLGSFNLDAYVKDKQFDFEAFSKDIPIVVKAMNEVLDEGLPLHPLEIQQQTVRDYRQIGIGVMGIADMLIHCEIKYGSNKSLELCDQIGTTLINGALQSSSLLAKEYGTYPKYKKCVMESEFFKNNATQETKELVQKYGLRNSQLLTIAPNGSLSTMWGVSGGIEPIFAFSYTRKTESLHDEDKYYNVYTDIVKEYMEENNLQDEKDLPSYFVNSETIDMYERIYMQSVWQRRIDASISSTINLPNSATVEDVCNLYMKAWEYGLKGLTIYRKGCKREGILTIDKPQKTKELQRGEWSKIPSDTIYEKRKIHTGCGKLVLFVGYSPSENRIIDMYVKRSADGGCVHNIDAVVIAMSGMLRLGGNLDNIEKAFRGCGTCNSFTAAKLKGKKLSKGKSCPTAILNAIKEVEDEIKTQELVDIVSNTPELKTQLEDEYDKFHSTFTEEEKAFIEENGQIAYANATNRCPVCNSELQNSGGCISCPSCLFSRCE